jgi:hypothetical protein
VQRHGEHPGRGLRELPEVSKDNPTKAERIAAAKARTREELESRPNPLVPPPPEPDPQKK